MTTEEKKCVCQKNSKGGIARHPNCPVNHIVTTPETGREWEEPNKPYGIRPAPGTCCPDMHKEIICRGCDHNHGSFDEAIASTLAQGEKIGAEKERARLSGWLMHDDNCKGLYFDPKKTSKCDCGLADALKG